MLTMKMLSSVIDSFLCNEASSINPSGHLSNPVQHFIKHISFRYKSEFYNCKAENINTNSNSGFMICLIFKQT